MNGQNWFSCLFQVCNFELETLNQYDSSANGISEDCSCWWPRVSALVFLIATKSHVLLTIGLCTVSLIFIYFFSLLQKSKQIFTKMIEEIDRVERSFGDKKRCQFMWSVPSLQPVAPAQWAIGCFWRCVQRDECETTHQSMQFPGKAVIYMNSVSICLPSLLSLFDKLVMNHVLPYVILQSCAVIMP